MRLQFIFVTFSALAAQVVCRDPLSYKEEPENLYTPTKSQGTTTLLDFINSKDDLSSLAAVLKEPAGFTKAFDTTPSWKFTFFAPSNTAFENTEAYFKTYAATKKGKFWLGNLLQHHYVPNTALKASAINSTLTRFQTGTYMYVSAQEKDGGRYLNGVAKITEQDIQVTNGVVHIIDHILDPSAQVFERELPNLGQTFIAGSCSNPSLPYC